MEPESSLPDQKYSPPVPLLSQLDPVNTPTSHFLKIHLNIILPSMPGSPKWSLSLRFPHRNPVYTSPLPHTCYMSRPSHSRFYHLNSTDQDLNFSCKLLSPPPPHQHKRGGRSKPSMGQYKNGHNWLMHILHWRNEPSTLWPSLCVVWH